MNFKEQRFVQSTIGHSSFATALPNWPLYAPVSLIVFKNGKHALHSWIPNDVWCHETRTRESRILSSLVRSTRGRQGDTRFESDAEVHLPQWSILDLSISRVSRVASAKLHTADTNQSLLHRKCITRYRKLSTIAIGRSNYELTLYTFLSRKKIVRVIREDVTKDPLSPAYRI